MTNNRRFGWHSGNVHARNITTNGQLSVKGAQVVGTLPLVSGKTWYVNPNLSKNGDGTSMAGGFTNITDALAVAGNYDVILVSQASIMTCPTAGWTITKTGLKIIGDNSHPGTQANAIKKIAGTTPIFTIKADRVEIANLCLSQRIAYAAIAIGDTAGQAYYQVYIHDCNIEGQSGSTYGITPGPEGAAANDQCDPVNLVVENCTFRGFAVAAITANGTRDAYLDNMIYVTTNALGINYLPASAGDRDYTTIIGNQFVGLSATTTKGILFASTPTVGTLALANNYLSGTWNVTITDTGSGCMNYAGDGSGGALINC
jgi:hypothetical protein